jgi:hypothetical protein
MEASEPREEAGTAAAGRVDLPDHQRHSRWIWVSALLGIIAVGVTIWALTLKSDLDTTQQALDRTTQEQASTKQELGTTEQQLAAAQQDVKDLESSQRRRTGAALVTGKVLYDEFAEQLGAADDELVATSRTSRMPTRRRRRRRRTLQRPSRTPPTPAQKRTRPRRRPNKRRLSRRPSSRRGKPRWAAPRPTSRRSAGCSRAPRQRPCARTFRALRPVARTHSRTLSARPHRPRDRAGGFQRRRPARLRVEHTGAHHPRPSPASGDAG